jgi:hypothetical protein
VQLLTARRQEVADIVEETGGQQFRIIGGGAAQMIGALEPVVENGESPNLLIGLLHRVGPSQYVDDAGQVGRALLDGVH